MAHSAFPPRKERSEEPWVWFLPYGHDRPGDGDVCYACVGLEVTKRGDRCGGDLYWLSKDGKRFTNDAFCSGLFDDVSNTLVFPLELKRGGSLKTVREGDSEYLEIEIRFESDELVGKWRTGTNPPYDERTFYLYEG